MTNADTTANAAPADAAAEACCSTSALQTCCAPEDKGACCGTPADAAPAAEAPSSCGCR
ncbi:hypothetical protein [Planomonospora algeriensis]